jgi:type II secretion system protein G
MNVLLCTLALFCATADQVETSRTADTLLYIRTVPSGAQILLDGKPLGSSDGLFPVEPGTYRIVVDLEGHEPQSQQISVRDGKITRIELELNQVPSVTSWTCPMHPQIKQPKPGKCPICQMDLITPSEPEHVQTELNQSSRTVMLPDVDRRDGPTVLDLASGKLVENIARNGDASAYIQLGKGDLWQDSGYFGTVRDATAMLWDGAEFTPFQTIRPVGGSIGYGKLTLPCRLLVTTAEQTKYDITILWMDGQGSARVDYRLADPSVVPRNSDSIFAYRKATTFVSSMEQALAVYQMDTGQYPTTTQGLEALIKRPSDMKAPGNWRGPYIRAISIPLDPWGHPYQYECIEKNDKPRVWSKGPDNKSGTSDDFPLSEVLANRMKSGSHLAAMGKAMLIYANDHDDQFPPDLDALVSEVELHPKLLMSPSKPEGFTGPSYVYVAGQGVSMHPLNVLAYENPAYCQDGLNVLYLDSHVAWQKRDEFLQALAATYMRLGRPMPDIQFKGSGMTEPGEPDNTIHDMILNDLDEGKGHEAIDLDTAKQYDLSVYGDGQGGSDPVHQLVSQSGVDLLADYARNRWALMTSDLTLKRYMPNEFWDRLGPAEVQVLVSLPQEANQGIEILDRSGFRFYILDRLAKAPLTFAFETGQGALGMLQVSEFREKPRAVSIRYRIVKRPLE